MTSPNATRSVFEVWGRLRRQPEQRLSSHDDAIDANLVAAGYAEQGYRHIEVYQDGLVVERWGQS